MRVTNPEAFKHPMIREFLIRAATANLFPAPEKAVDHLAAQIQSPGMGVFVGADRGTPKALAVCVVTGDPLFPWPQLLAAYNEGRRELSPEVGKEVIQFCRQLGYDKIWGINRSGKPDEMWAKVFSHTHRGYRPVGTWMEFDLKE